MCTHCDGFMSAAANAMRSSAVSRVCRRDDTNTRTGLAGECVCTAAYAGLFMVAMRGQ